MKSFMRLPSLILVAASLLATLPARAQLNDGKPDPTLEVPPRLDLEYSLAFALDNNFAIRQARERIKQQEGVVVEVSAREIPKERIRQQEGIVLEVKSAIIPNVNSTAGYQQNADEISTNGRDTAWAVDVTARQILWAGGGVTASINAQKLALDAAILELKSVINDALFEVRVRFYTVLVNRERIKVQEESVDLLQKQLQDVKNRFDAGTVSNFRRPAPIGHRSQHRVGTEQSLHPGQRPAGPHHCAKRLSRFDRGTAPVARFRDEQRNESQPRARVSRFAGLQAHDLRFELFPRDRSRAAP